MAPSTAPAHQSPRLLAPHAMAASSFPETSPERLGAAAKASSSLGAKVLGTSALLPQPGLHPLIPRPHPASSSLAQGARPRAPMALVPHWWLLQAWRRGWEAQPHSGEARSPWCQPAQRLMSATCSEAANPSSAPASPAISLLLGPWKALPALPPASTALAQRPCVQEPVTTRSPAISPQAWASPEQPVLHHWPRSMPAAVPHPSPTPW